MTDIAHSRKYSTDFQDDMASAIASVKLIPPWSKKFTANAAGDDAVERVADWALSGELARIKGNRLNGCLHGLYLTGCVSCPVSLDHFSWWYCLTRPNEVFLIGHEYGLGDELRARYRVHALHHGARVDFGTPEESWYYPGQASPVVFSWHSEVYACPLTAAIENNSDLSALEERLRKEDEKRAETGYPYAKAPWLRTPHVMKFH